MTKIERDQAWIAGQKIGGELIQRYMENCKDTQYSMQVLVDTATTLLANHLANVRCVENYTRKIEQNELEMFIEDLAIMTQYFENKFKEENPKVKYFRSVPYVQ